LAEENENTGEELAELRDYIRRIENNQQEERARLREIQDELNGMLRTQNTIMSKIIAAE
jgi:hypothetical protein